MMAHERLWDEIQERLWDEVSQRCERMRSHTRRPCHALYPWQGLTISCRADGCEGIVGMTFPA